MRIASNTREASTGSHECPINLRILDIPNTKSLPTLKTKNGTWKFEHEPFKKKNIIYWISCESSINHPYLWRCASVLKTIRFLRCIAKKLPTWGPLHWSVTCCRTSEEKRGAVFPGSQFCDVRKMYNITQTRRLDVLYQDIHLTCIWSKYI